VVNRAFTALLMLPMTCAGYFVIDESPSKEWKHYALAIPYYTHFTSPIRRYADVMVHRLLLEGLKLEKQQKHAHPKGNERSEGERKDDLAQLHRRYPFDKLHEIASQCNRRKESADAAQMRSDIVYLGVYLMSHPTPAAEAVVLGVSNKSIFLLVLDLSLQMTIFLDKQELLSLPDCPFDEDSSVLTLRHKDTGKEVQLTYMSRVLVQVYADPSPPRLTVEVALSAATFNL